MTEASCMNPTDLLLPPASRLVHIGPHKTGTTSVQHAFHVNREELRRHRVHYTGPSEQPLLAALAVAGGGGMKGDRPPRPEDWTELVDEVRAAGEQRVVVSSEFLCYADDAAARRVVTEIPGGPVHVVITLRSVAKIAPSQWQQYVQNGLRVPYTEWLDGMFRRPPYDQPTPSFWRRHAHGELVRRWAEAAGPENLTVVVADESDPAMLLRTFEALVGLPEGVLELGDNAANRSLARGEIELVRFLNESFHKHGWAEPWTPEAHARIVRRGVVRQMKTGRRPAPDEARLTMPDWAVERAAEADARTVESIKASGVRVIGNLDSLAQVSARKGDEDAGGPILIPADAAALAVLGAMSAGSKPGEGTRFAAALAVLAATSGAKPRFDSAGIPLLPAGAAARAALGVMEARAARDVFMRLPKVPSDTGALALFGAARGGRGKPTNIAALAGVRPLLDALGVRQPGKPAQPKPTLPATIDDEVIRKASTPDLLKVVAKRVRRRVERGLKR
ncbi:MAG TPA: hypothetical protein VFT67_06410 [Jatrophihabitantaceae bacterium]|nr:hypothetical protein [Jatrophihabitantaceae bacterium]